MKIFKRYTFRIFDIKTSPSRGESGNFFRFENHGTSSWLQGESFSFQKYLNKHRLSTFFSGQFIRHKINVNKCVSGNPCYVSNVYQENQSIAQGSRFLARAGSFIILYRYRTFYIYLGHQISEIDCKYFKTRPNLLRANYLEYKVKIVALQTNKSTREEIG